MMVRSRPWQILRYAKFSRVPHARGGMGATFTQANNKNTPVLRADLVKEGSRHSRSFLVVFEYSTSFTPSSPTTKYEFRKMKRNTLEPR